MTTYLIDYENVNASGLKGIKNLSRNDKVLIFCGINTKYIPIDTHIDILKSKAKIEYFLLDKSGKNYLDFQITAHLGMMIGKGNKGPFVIVSKDNGFDSAVDFAEKHGAVCVRQTAIEIEQNV